VIRAASLSETVATLLKRQRVGTVLATFARSAYLDLDGSIVALVAEELLNGPLNVVLAAGTDPPFDRLTAGSAVTASAEAIHIEGWPSIAIGNAARWDPHITAWTAAQMARVIMHLAILTEAVTAETAMDHLAYPRMQAALAALRSGLGTRSPTVVAAAAGDLAGLGGGLTPSGDDVLVGGLVALAALPDRRTDGLRDIIRDAAAGRTTRISEAYLQAAARGEASEAWQRLLAALAGHLPDDVRGTAQKVRAFGETSGADVLTGFLLTLDEATQATQTTQLAADTEPNGTSR
jgi:hypothetical protein